jgi:hypothetical protein
MNWRMFVEANCEEQQQEEYGWKLASVEIVGTWESASLPTQIHC